MARRIALRLAFVFLALLGAALPLRAEEAIESFHAAIDVAKNRSHDRDRDDPRQG
ncbi:MAG: hypothetical protein KL863_12155 [Rhizobium sp.]|nr:hypothetical protein [Rhizobium sp.]